MTQVVEYIVGSLGWSILGFMAGWAAASLRTDLTTIKEQVMSEHEHESPRARPVRRHRPATAQATRWLGIVVALLAVVTVAQGVIVSHQLKESTACQAEYNDRFAMVLTIRARLYDEDRHALNKLIGIIAANPGGEDSIGRAIQNYVETVEENEVDRLRTPLPNLDSKC